jgi:midasin (ATPase involved in ribosome maturation)
MSGTPQVFESVTRALLRIDETSRQLNDQVEGTQTVQNIYEYPGSDNENPNEVSARTKNEEQRACGELRLTHRSKVISREESYEDKENILQDNKRTVVRISLLNASSIPRPVLPANCNQEQCKDSHRKPAKMPQ